jgi:hypothetical protein
MTRQPTDHVAVRLLNKGTHGKADRTQGELRVYCNRHDGTFDRVGTFGASMGRVATLRSIIAAGCMALGIEYSDETDRDGDQPPTAR